MKNFKNILFITLVFFSLLSAPVKLFAQADDFDDFANCPSGNYDDCFGPSTPSNSGGASGSSGAGCNLVASPKIQDVFSYMSCILNIAVVPLIFSLALASFVFGVVQYVLNESDEGKREKGKQFMVWGIIALTVMVSVWGLVNMLGSTFNIDTRIVPSVTPN